MKTVLLMGLKLEVLEAVRRQLRSQGAELLVATGIDDLRSALSGRNVDAVISGGGLPLAVRLEAVRAVFEHGDQTSVHLKDVASGAEGYLPFVQRVLDGLLGPGAAKGSA